MAATDTQFVLYTYEEFPRFTRLVNIHQLEYFLWLCIPQDVSKASELFQVDEIIPNNGEVDYLNYIQRECGRQWLKVGQAMLNIDIGFHVYKFSFVNRQTNDISALYFSYIIQNNDPVKSYDYMERFRRQVGQ